ncbi:MAG: molecular chaperone [Gammaproteobacteria bacterium]
MTGECVQIEGDNQLRANVYSLLAALLARPPGEELLERLQQIEEADADQGLMTTAWQHLKQASLRCSGSALQDEYQQLFIGLGRGELVPYGSWYLTGFLMEKPLARLRRDLARLGIARRETTVEPEDHIASICEAMAMLIGQPEEYTWEIQRRFFLDHIIPWAADFFSDLVKAKQANFYRSVGSLGLSFLDVEKEYLAMEP